MRDPTDAFYALTNSVENSRQLRSRADEPSVTLPAINTVVRRNRVEHSVENLQRAINEYRSIVRHDSSSSKRGGDLTGFDGSAEVTDGANRVRTKERSLSRAEVLLDDMQRQVDMLTKQMKRNASTGDIKGQNRYSSPAARHNHIANTPAHRVATIRSGLPPKPSRTSKQ